MNKEAIEIIEKIKDQASRATMVQDRSVGIIKQTCGVISKECDQALALLTEQPPAGELMKEAIELDKMCVSEIVAKYESSHNAITVLKRKFREACESDEWMKSATEFYENGGCPICFSTDEAGCTEGCYLGQLQAKLTEQPPASNRWQGGGKEPERQEWDRKEQPPTGEFTKELINTWNDYLSTSLAISNIPRKRELCRKVNELIGKVCTRLDCSKSSRKELLAACESYVEWFERVTRYQNQRLGHGLEEACKTWGEASLVEPFDCTKMKAIIKSNKENAEKERKL